RHEKGAATQLSFCNSPIFCAQKQNGTATAPSRFKKEGEKQNVLPLVYRTEPTPLQVDALPG
ncbi:hypothetical protein, partial [Subdoligranulum variabile]|uniref:hypothetical protein n=1 Tax=Subdoligranulum variabile TaxID=214851 RepID=UPI0026EF407A